MSGRPAAMMRTSLTGCTAVVFTLAVALGSVTASAQAATDCRASAARATSSPQLVSEPVVANPSGSPCVTESQQAAGVQPIGGATVTDPHADTRNEPGVLAASASVDSASLGTGLQAVTVGHVSATQQQTCTAGTSATTGASSVDALVVAGVPVSVVGTQAIDQTIAGVRIRTNQTDGTSRQALIVDIGTTQYVLGDVRASGDACASLNNNQGGQGSGGGQGGSGGNAGRTLDRVCPSGATYDVPSNTCVITRTSSAGSTQTVVVGQPYSGPSGGTVITLADAQERARQGTLPNSPCLQGPGPKYVVIGTAGNDHITGTNRGDRILGLAGNDRIDGGRGNDCIDGNNGADTLTGGEGSDRVYGAAGNDHLNGGPGNDLLSGGAGGDTINTSFGRDRVSGGAGDDAINAATAGPPATIDGGPGRNIVRINRNERKHTRHATTIHVIT